VISRLSGHIGDNAAALVDGQLNPEATEKAWAHVLGCPGCRQVVEYEAWVKRRLNSLAQAPSVLEPRPSEQLVHSLYSVSGSSESRPVPDSVRHPLGAALLGTGALGLVVAGVFAVGATQSPGQPEVSSTRPSLGVAALASGALSLIDPQTPRIGDSTGLPGANPGRSMGSGPGRLPK